VTLHLCWLSCAAALQPLLSLNSGETGQQYLLPASCMTILLFISQIACFHCDLQACITKQHNVRCT
jgi:hypothetical protein